MQSPTADNDPLPHLEAGTPAFWRTNFAMFFGGFATFAMLYGTQAMLPIFTTEFDISPATASLSVSVGTAGLALMLIPASILADRYGRRQIMRASLLLAAIIALGCAAVTDFHQLLILRALLGIALAGLPASAMAYLGEEMAPNAQNRAMGIYIAGNAMGGMSGRFLAALIAEWTSWHVALAALGVLGSIAAFIFWRYLPASRHFHPRAAAIGRILHDARRIGGDKGLLLLFLIASLLMGTFIGLYNYLGFHLSEAPFNLSHTAVSTIFLLYILGIWGSTWSGRLADRLGRHNVLWAMAAAMGCGLAITLANQLPLVIFGVALFTFGFFGTHTVASGWVGYRAREQRALATALYLCSYYFGGSVLGSLSGLAWHFDGWIGVSSALGLCILIVFIAAWRLRRLQLIAQQHTDR